MVLLVHCKQWLREDRIKRTRNRAIRAKQRLQRTTMLQSEMQHGQNNDGADEQQEQSPINTNTITNTNINNHNINNHNDNDNVKEIRTFMDVAYASHGKAGSVCVQILLFVLQAGVCCVFLSLIATNLHAGTSTRNTTIALSQQWCVCLTTLCLMAIVLVKDLKNLKWLSLGANCLMVTAILTASASALWVLWQARMHGGIDGNDNNNDKDNPQRAKKWTNNPAAIATFVSSMFYSFEGIGLVMPVENSFVGYNNNKHSTTNDAADITRTTDTDNTTLANDDGDDTNSSSSSSSAAGDGNNHCQILIGDANVNVNVNVNNNEDENDHDTNNVVDDNNNNNDEEELRKASRIKSFVDPVLLRSMGVVALLFLLIGSTCGPAFPDIQDGSVTAYLTTRFPNSVWYKIINASVMLAVFLTFPLQLTPAMEVLEEWCGVFRVFGGNTSGSGTRTITQTITQTRMGITRGGGRHTRIAQHEPPSDEFWDDEHEQEDEDEEQQQQQQQHPPVMSEAATAAGATNNTRGDGLFVVQAGAAAASCDNINTNINTHDNSTNGNALQETTIPLPFQSCHEYEWIVRRWLVVLGCAVVVLTVNDLGLLMSLFGALGNTGLAAMPCVIHWKLIQKEIAPRNLGLMAMDVCTVLMSASVAVAGVVFSVQEILSSTA